MIMINTTFKITCLSIVSMALVAVTADGVVHAAPPNSQSDITIRNTDYAEQLENWFRTYLVDEYPERAAKAWNRSYESVEAFHKSVALNREHWRKIMAPPDFEAVGPLERIPHPMFEDVGGEWLRLPLGAINAEALLIVPPSDQPVPLIVAQHGIGSNPEKVFGRYDDGNLYHDYGHALLDEGFAVLAPFNLATIQRRNRIERLARLADMTLPGIELTRVQRLLDEVLQDPRIDRDRVGMWGISIGGMATMFWMPLEPRLKVGVVTAWFNHRRNKMVLPDSRYSCFLDTEEEHAFFRGWLTEYTDSDAVSLICPRPLLIQTGKKDRIAWWPQVLEEFEASKAHYDALDMADRIKMELHEGGHEIHLRSGIAFLHRWLSPSSDGDIHRFGP